MERVGHACRRVCVGRPGRRGLRLALALGGLGAAVVAAGCQGPPPAERVETTQSALNFPGNPLGNLSVLSPDEGPPIKIAVSGAWTATPGLSTAVYARPGDALAISVSAEMYGTDSIWMRALVDGAVAAPNDVQLKAGSVLFDGTRSFTFVVPRVSQGQHIVEIQWLVGKGGTVSIRDRSLVVHAAAPGGSDDRLSVVAAPSGPLIAKTTATWEDIPALATWLTSTAAEPWAIQFSAEAFAPKGRFMVRALLDDAVVADATFLSADMSERAGTRSFTFVAPNVAAGPHLVKLQWLADSGGRILVGDRTLTVAAAPTVHRGGISEGFGHQGPPTAFTDSWTDVGGLLLVFGGPQPAGSSFAVTAGGEVYTSGPGRLFLRAVVDGVPSRPADVTLIQGGAGMRAASHTFVLKNLRRGLLHGVRIQIASDNGTVSYLRDRYLYLQARQRSGSSFAQAFAPIGLGYGLAPRQRLHRALVLCLDPGRPEHPAPSEAVVRNQISGNDSGLSLRGWLASNTGGRVALGGVQLVNCGPFAPAPPEHSGWWYWQGGNVNRHEEAWRDAIRAADAQVNFHALDLNGDRRVSRDELALFIVRPQNGPYGTVREISVAVDGDPAPLSFRFEDMFLSPNAGQRRAGVGMLAHETGHYLLDGDEMYTGDSCPSYPQLAGRFNIMDVASQATHLGPLEKLKSALVTPDAIAIDELTTQTVPLGSVAGRREVTIVYDPLRQDREYFVIENRWGSGDPYQGLAPVDSVVVWLLIEDRALAEQHPPPGGAACHWKPKSTRRLANLQNVGDSYELRWADGSPAGVRITTKGPIGDLTSVELARVP